MKDKRSLWISMMSVVIIAFLALAGTIAAGWSPKLGLDLDGGCDCRCGCRRLKLPHSVIDVGLAHVNVLHDRS